MGVFSRTNEVWGVANFVFFLPLIVIEYRAGGMHITIDEEIKSTLTFALSPPLPV